MNLPVNENLPEIIWILSILAVGVMAFAVLLISITNEQPEPRIEDDNEDDWNL